MIALGRFLAILLLPLISSYDLLDRLLEMAPTTSPSPPCNPHLEQTINGCSYELSALGVFSQFPSRGGEPLSLNELKTRSREYFVQICHAYNRFNKCIGGSYIKQACYAQEPIKARFAVADAALAFVCGEGYHSMLLNWDCFLSAASRADVTGCEARIGEGFTPPELDQMTTACTSLREYAECIRMPIHTQCGLDAWETVVEAIERPVQVYLPYCTLAAGNHIPSLIAVIMLLILASC